VVIDDGAHTNRGCANTIFAAAPYVRPGGILIVEDLHTSFSPSFGNPSRLSAYSLGCFLAEGLSRAYGRTDNTADSKPSASRLGDIQSRVYSVNFYRSMMVIRLRADGRAAPNVSVSNGGAYMPEQPRSPRSSRSPSTVRQRILAAWATTPEFVNARIDLDRIMTRISSWRRGRTLTRDLRKEGLYWEGKAP